MTVDELKQTFIKAINDVTGMELTWDNLTVSSIRSIDGNRTEASLVARESVPGNPNTIVGETTVIYERIDISADALVIDARDLLLGFKSEYRTKDVLEWIRTNTELDLPESEFVDDVVRVQQGTNATFTLRTVNDSIYFIGALQCEIVFPAMAYVDYTLFSETAFDLRTAGAGDIENKIIIYVDGELFSDMVIPAGEHRVVIYGIDSRLEHTKIPAIKLHKLYLQAPTDIATVGFNTPILSPTITEVDFKAIYSERAHLSGLFHGNPNPITLPAILFEYLGADIKTDGLFRNSGVTTIENTLFSGVKLVTLVSAFDGCEKLVSIPAGILSGQSELTTATSMFKGSGVTVLPEGLLKDCVKLTDISYMFAQSKLRVIQGPMGNGCGAVKAESLFAQCKFTEVSELVFKGMAALADLTSAFVACEFNNVTLTSKMFEDQISLVKIESIFTNALGIDSVSKLWINSPITNASVIFLRSTVKRIEGPLIITDGELVATSAFETCAYLSSVKGILFEAPNAVNISRLFMNSSRLVELDYVFNPEHTMAKLQNAFNALSGVGAVTLKDYWLGRRHTNSSLNVTGLLSNTPCYSVGKTLDFGNMSATIKAGSFLRNNGNIVKLPSDLVYGPNITLTNDTTTGMCSYNRHLKITTQELINAFNVKTFNNLNTTMGIFEGLYWLEGSSAEIISRYGISLSVAKNQNWFRQCFRLSDYYSSFKDSLRPNDYPVLDLVSSRGWDLPITLSHLPLPSPYDRDGFPWVPFYRTVGLQFSATELTNADTLEKRISLLGNKIDYDLSSYTWYTRPFVNLPYYGIKVSGDVYSIQPLPDEITDFKSTYFVIRRS